MSKYVIIDKESGTVIPLSTASLVNIEKLSEDDAQTLYDCEGDSLIIDIATREGKEIEIMLARSGFGDLNYGNCISYSPIAIRDELYSRVDAYREIADAEPDDEEIQKMMSIVAWALTLDNDTLSEIAEFILNDDNVWLDYMVNLLDGLLQYHTLIFKNSTESSE